jgi:nitrite reductase/ring-hydroxylating ferredoxin subunit
MSGKRVCRIEDIPDRQAKGFPIDGAEYDIFVYREDSTLRAFVNSCPHQGTPLDWLPDRFVSLDGEHFLCATHGALFRLEDGECVAGPCQGKRLRSVPILLIEDWVVLP